jgi:hypothetical protein
MTTPGHERNVRLAVAGDGVVQNVFDAIDFMHERIIAAMLEHDAHVSSRAESPLAGPAHHNSRDFPVDAPRLQTRMQCLDQRHVDDVENVRPIEHRNADRACNLMQH